MTTLLLTALLAATVPSPGAPLPSTAQISTPSQPADDIRDIHGPLPVPHPPYLWLALGAMALGLAGFAYVWYRRRRSHVWARSPDEIAKERLELARLIMFPTSVREFSFAVSEAVRLYIEQRFNLRAESRTSEEFLHDLVVEPSSPLAPWRVKLGTFLGQCDLAKFAKGQMSRSEMEALLTGAQSFVDETTGAPS